MYACTSLLSLTDLANDSNGGALTLPMMLADAPHRLKLFARGVRQW